MTPKNALERRELIRTRLLQTGSVSSSLLAEEFDVSLMTIYRDLDYLQSLGIARRASGGAVLKQRFFASPHSSAHIDPNLQSVKCRIGRYAALNLVDEGDGAIVIGGGTTTLEMARALPDMSLNIMANSLEVLGVLSVHHHTRLYALGGELRKDIMAFGGTMAHANLQQYHFAKAFIGIDGVDLDAHLTCSNDLNARLTALMAAHSDEVFLLTDLSKFGRKAFRHVLSFHHLSGIVVDDELPKSYADVFREHQVKVMVAE